MTAETTKALTIRFFANDDRFAIVPDGPRGRGDVSQCRIVGPDCIFEHLGATAAEVALASLRDWQRNLRDENGNLDPVHVDYSLSSALWFARENDLARAIDTAEKKLNELTAVQTWTGAYGRPEGELVFGADDPGDGLPQAMHDTLWKEIRAAKAEVEKAYAAAGPKLQQAAEKILANIGDRRTEFVGKDWVA